MVSLSFAEVRNLVEVAYQFLCEDLGREPTQAELTSRLEYEVARASERAADILEAESTGN